MVVLSQTSNTVIDGDGRVEIFRRMLLTVDDPSAPWVPAMQQLPSVPPGFIRASMWATPIHGGDNPLLWKVEVTGTQVGLH